MIKTSASLLACDLANISGELSRCKALGLGKAEALALVERLYGD